MNRQQIETTPAGPELDALVAEAKGWEEYHTDEWVEFAGAVHKSAAGFWRKKNGEIVAHKYEHPWSTEIAAAWELVEERHQKRDYLTLTYLMDVGPSPYYLAEFRMSKKWGKGITAPEAITRAYLLAKLED